MPAGESFAELYRLWVITQLYDRGQVLKRFQWVVIFYYDTWSEIFETILAGDGQLITTSENIVRAARS